MQSIITSGNVKAKAKELKSLLKEDGVDLPLGKCQQLLAQLHGSRNFEELQARAKSMKQELKELAAELLGEHRDLFHFAETVVYDEHIDIRPTYLAVEMDKASMKQCCRIAIDGQKNGVQTSRFYGAHQDWFAYSEAAEIVENDELWRSCKSLDEIGELIQKVSVEQTEENLEDDDSDLYVRMDCTLVVVFNDTIYFDGFIKHTDVRCCLKEGLRYKSILPKLKLDLPEDLLDHFEENQELPLAGRFSIEKRGGFDYRLKGWDANVRLSNPYNALTIFHQLLFIES